MTVSGTSCAFTAIRIIIQGGDGLIHLDKHWSINYKEKLVEEILQDQDPLKRQSEDFEETRIEPEFPAWLTAPVSSDNHLESDYEKSLFQDLHHQGQNSAISRENTLKLISGITHSLGRILGRLCSQGEHDIAIEGEVISYRTESYQCHSIASATGTQFTVLFTNPPQVAPIKKNVRSLMANLALSPTHDKSPPTLTTQSTLTSDEIRVPVNHLSQALHELQRLWVQNIINHAMWAVDRQRALSRRGWLLALQHWLISAFLPAVLGDQ